MNYESNSLQHYGIKGQKWGLRRFQNQDGTLTADGKARYGVNKAGGALSDLRDNSVKRGPKTDNKKPGLSLPKRKETVLDKIDKFRDSTIKKGGPTKGLKTNGVYDREDGSKDTDRLKKDAKKDAEDMARAKAYYGEGAGNRRKQIRNRISERMKDPDYKAEYEKQLAAQDMSKHQKAANRERKANDVKNAVAKTGRGIKNLIMGFGSASMAAVALYNIAKLTGADKKIAELGKKTLREISSKLSGLKKPSVKDYDWQHSKSSYTVPKSSYTVPESSYRTWIDKDGNIHVK